MSSVGAHRKAKDWRTFILYQDRSTIFSIVHLANLRALFSAKGCKTNQATQVQVCVRSFKIGLLHEQAKHEHFLKLVQVSKQAQTSN